MNAEHKSQEELVTELMGTRCRCGGRKRSRQTLCSGCYFKLPRMAQLALYDRVGEGYEKAYAAACDLLDNSQ